MVDKVAVPAFGASKLHGRYEERDHDGRHANALLIEEQAVRIVVGIDDIAGGVATGGKHGRRSRPARQGHEFMDAMFDLLMEPTPGKRKGE